MKLPVREVLLIENEHGYEIMLTFEQQDLLVEFGSELGEDDASFRQKVEVWVKNQYPYLKIHTVKIVMGTLLLSSIPLTPGEVTRVHAAASVSQSAAQAIQIVVNGNYVTADEKPINVHGRVIVPVRAIVEALGAEVKWDGAKREVTITRGDKIITLKIGSSVATVNGSLINLDVQAQIINNRTFVPVRFISEALGAGVSWDNQTQTVFVQEEALLYKVVSGDTLTKIANRFGVRIEDIKQWNQLEGEGDIIYIDQRLRIYPQDASFVRNEQTEVAQELHGYAVVNYKGDNNSLISLRQNASRLTSVSTFTHQLNADGTITATNDVPISTVTFAKAANIPVYMLVHNLSSDGFSKQLVRQVLSDDDKQAVLIDQILREVKRYGFTGVEIDFEGIGKEDRANYTSFLKKLTEKLDPNGIPLMVAIPAKTWDDPNNGWSGGYDYKTIGEVVDRVMIMSYDENWAGGSPGPIASLPWFEKVIKYASSTIPKEKILMGIAAYAYDWPMNGGSARGLSSEAVESLIIKYGGKAEWDAVAYSPVYRYVDSNGVKHEVWFENEQSLEAKASIVREYGVAGYGIWRLGLEKENLWTVLNQENRADT